MAKKIIKKIQNIFTAKVAETFKTEKQETTLEEMKLNLLGIKKDELSDFKSKFIIEDDDELTKMKKALLNIDTNKEQEKPIVEVVEVEATIEIVEPIQYIETIQKVENLIEPVLIVKNINDGLCNAKPPYLKELEEDYNNILKEQIIEDSKKPKKVIPKKDIPKKDIPKNIVPKQENIIKEDETIKKEKNIYKIVDTEFDDKIVRKIEIVDNNFITLEIFKKDNNYNYYLNQTLKHFYVYNFDKIIFSSLDFIDNDDDSSNNILEITKDKIHFNGFYYSIHTIQFSNIKY